MCSPRSALSHTGLGGFYGELEKEERRTNCPPFYYYNSYGELVSQHLRGLD